ncbi:MULTISPECIES: hypothetical protein [Lacrimispora]|jgi:hypothetical protein|uniref:hypothetical protein n=1 Tax=Lacrimispora TaxID=2719231 RepID=UPI000BE35E8D|nr:hypothetical protein [Lacrimispora amygdalina]MDK2965255.1 hypothetical protein [Lacrimispora sp.]
MKLKNKFQRGIALILSLIMILSCSVMNVIAAPSGEYNISINDNIVTENAVIYIDGQTVQLTRVTQPGGKTLVTTTSGSDSYTNYGTINYQELLKRIESEKNASSSPNMLMRADTAHSSNCYHTVIAENSVTVTRAEGATSAAAIAGILASAFTANPVIIAKVAKAAYDKIRKSDIGYEEVTEQVNEVYFKADNTYYTHCYHDTIKCYDAFGHYVSSYTQRHQAVGG